MSPAKPGKRTPIEEYLHVIIMTSAGGLIEIAILRTMSQVPLMITPICGPTARLHFFDETVTARVLGGDDSLRSYITSRADASDVKSKTRAGH
jgi:hypothetical protein